MSAAEGCSWVEYLRAIRPASDVAGSDREILERGVRPGYAYFISFFSWSYVFWPFLSSL